MKSVAHFALFLAGLALFTASAACFSTAAAPPAAESPTESLFVSTSSPGPTMAPGDIPLPTQVPGIPEHRRVTLEFPPRIRSGDSDIVRLTLEIDVLDGATPTSESEGNKITGETVEIPNLYATHNVIAEARLDLAGVEIRPPGIVQAPMGPGQAVTFFWSVRPLSKGTFKGTAWLFLRFVDKQTGEESQRALSAQTVEIRTTDLFGFSAGFARTTGAIGSVIGGIIGFPFFEDIVKLILRRFRRSLALK